MCRIGKRMLLLVLALSLAMCGMSLAEDAAGPAEARLLDDLAKCTEQEEQLFSTMLWMVSYVEKYQEEGTWDSLQMARAAVSVAYGYIEDFQSAEMEFTEEDMMLLTDRGEDVTYVPFLRDSIEESRADLLTTCESLQMFLHDSIYYASDRKMTFQDASLIKQSAELHLQFNAAQMDYTTRQITGAERLIQFERAIAGTCPLTSAHRDMNADLDACVARAGEILDQLEELNSEQQKVSGRLRASLDHLVASIENVDFSWYKEKFVEITGIPRTVVYPEWLDGTESWIYYWEDGENLILPQHQEDLPGAPDGALIIQGDVARETVLNYQQELEQSGLFATAVEDTEEGLSILYSFDVGSLSLEWLDGRAEIRIADWPCCLVPVWFYLGGQAE